MHKTRFNSLNLEFNLIPCGPLLVKAGGISTDPTLPDMQFVRTYHAERGEIVYIPGSSLKGVIRSFIEKALRTLDERNTWKWACTTFPDDPESCAKKLEDVENSAEIYRRSCGACRIFGHTRLRGRAAFTDLLPQGQVHTEIRYGVAISRLSHSVAQGPFEMEIAVDGSFTGRLLLENYELWQLGLLNMAFEAVNGGLVKVGFGKNRGFGEVQVAIQHARVEEIIPVNQAELRGLAAFINQDERDRYGIPFNLALDALPQPEQSETLGFYQRRTYGLGAWKEISAKAMEILYSGPRE